MQILSNLKESFWPFQQNQSRSLFLRAVDVANCSDRSNAIEERYFNYLNLQHRPTFREAIYFSANCLASPNSLSNNSLRSSAPPFQLELVDMCINISVSCPFYLFQWLSACVCKGCSTQARTWSLDK